MIRRQNLTKEQALQKLKHYCAYQERCHSEVKEKLYSLGLWKKDVEEVVSLLIEENYLNEERFAIQFAGGHFRTKYWGKVKILYALKQKQVGEYCIKKAISAIDETDYRKTLEKLARNKWEALTGEENLYVRRRKLQDYLMQKGYEADLAAGVVKEVSLTGGEG